MPLSFRLHRLDLFVVALAALCMWLLLASMRGGLGGYVPSPDDSENGSVQPLGWRDLKLLDPKSGSVEPRLAEFSGEIVRVPGYIVPLEDFQSRTSQFLLVPYVGACIHSPPPPPNQIVAVQMVNGPVAFEMWEPYWVSGRLFIEEAQSPYGPASFQMRGLEIAPFEVPE